LNGLGLAVIYLVFFLSGTAALIYQVIWVRSFSLVFGGSHLAVATVLTVFMGGLALGSYLIGRYGNRSGLNMLRLYGYLELGIAISALIFLGLIRLYPPIYIFFADFFPNSNLYMSIIRVIFATCAIIIPTTLMGATLPVLSEFFTQHKGTIGIHLSMLYAVNTLGAVIGAASAGFILLPQFSVLSTALLAISINTVIGLLCIKLNYPGTTNQESAIPQDFQASESDSQNILPPFVLKMVLIGIGISGFCALGYEVLWSRILSIVVGKSVYGFTIILVAFLSGIGCGSLCYGYINKIRHKTDRVNQRATIAWFGILQVLIGIFALTVSVKLLDLPVNKSMVMKYFMDKEMAVFHARQLSSIVLSFAYMFVPAFLMGVAFPMAGKIHTLSTGIVRRATGDILSYNTIGAILGSATSGFILVYTVGIERSLQILIIMNIGLGLIILTSLMNKTLYNWCAVTLPLVTIFVLLSSPDSFKIWGDKWFAVYKANEMEGYITPQMIKGMLANTEVLYYGEGVEAIVSSVRTGSYQGFITNGRTESSNTPADLQCVYTLGHLPMLLAKEPKKIFVLGTGAGVTLGATSVYPSVEQITLVEIEPKVLGVARTFDRYNHQVLDNPKLKIVINDGRNFLLTTKEKFDVITADPVHPWFSGAGYLYTDEYFSLAASRLTPGGVICQWVPIYELSEANLKSIVATFRKNFKYTMLWLTQYNAELVGSNTPIILDEQDLERKISNAVVRSDLTSVNMGTARSFMSYFIIGNKGLGAFSRGGTINTDNNIYLEFSAPLSMGNTDLVAENIHKISALREDILPYVKSASTKQGILEQQSYWRKNMEAAKIKDQAHRMYYTQGQEHNYIQLLNQIDQIVPDYAPHRIMYDEYRSILKMMGRD
jgi:spermidine synthase